MKIQQSGSQNMKRFHNHYSQAVFHLLAKVEGVGMDFKTGIRKTISKLETDYLQVELVFSLAFYIWPINWSIKKTDII